MDYVLGAKVSRDARLSAKTLVGSSGIQLGSLPTNAYSNSKRRISIIFP